MADKSIKTVSEKLLLSLYTTVQSLQGPLPPPCQ